MDTLTQYCIGENVRWLQIAPLIDEAFRKRLIALAEAGLDVYAYQSAAGKWNLWVMENRYEVEACNNMSAEERMALL